MSVDQPNEWLKDHPQLYEWFAENPRACALTVTVTKDEARGTWSATSTQGHAVSGAESHEAALEAMKAMLTYIVGGRVVAAPP